MIEKPLDFSLLVVTDSANIDRYKAGFGREIGITPFFATSPDQARQMFKSFDINAVVYPNDLLFTPADFRKKDPNTAVAVTTTKPDTTRFDDLVGVWAFEAGADQFFREPIQPRVLASYMRSVVRRTRENIGEEDYEHFVLGDFDLDFIRYEFKKKGKQLSLREKEVNVLKAFVLNRGKLLTREQLLDHAWGAESYLVEARNVDVQVRALREKMEDDPGKPKYFQSVRGFGYKFNIETSD